MRKLLIATLMFLGLVVLAPNVGAVTVIDCNTAGVPADQCATVKQNDLDYQSGASRVWSVVSLALGVLGGIAVIMIVIGGIKFATSQGDSSQIASAKKTILFSVIGLVVAMLSSAIVLLIQNYFL
ncbi:MAG: pilin [Candidatus Saccharimonas sp.]